MLVFAREHTVGLSEDGTIWAWGSNAAGQLGGGTTEMHYYHPVQIKVKK